MPIHTYIHINTYMNTIEYILISSNIPAGSMSSPVGSPVGAGRGHPSRAGLWLRGFHRQSLAGTRPAGVTWRNASGSGSYVDVNG